MNNWEDLTTLEKACIRELSEQSLSFYSRAMFRFQEGSPMLRNWHIELICDELELVEKRETDNLIINLPPGGGKTHLSSVCFPSRGLARNPKSRFLVVSYSNDLVKDISTRVRDLVFEGEEFQEMWALQSSKDSNEKSHWKLLDDRGKKTGEFKCASSGGSITGFRAGKLHRDKYYGALIMDDPNKPSDMLTERKREKSNEVWDTVRTRMASSVTPTVVIQQRLHDQDATGFKLSKMECIEDGKWYKVWRNKNGSGRKWKQIIIPALIDDEFVASLPEKYRNRVTGMFYGSDDKGRYSYWPEKETLEVLLDHEVSNGYLFAAQYQQDPVRLGGNLMPPSVWKWYNKSMAPKFDFRFITGDTALKAKDSSDYTVFAHFGVADGNLYLIDYIRGKWESPQMRVKLLSFIADGTALDKERFGILRGVWIEDAVSGVGLIAECRNASPVPINPYRPNKHGKGASCQDTLPYLDTKHSTGRVYLPEDMDQAKLTVWVSEHADFTLEGAPQGKHDDTCDNTFMAVSIGLRQVTLSHVDVSGISIGGTDNGTYVF